MAGVGNAPPWSPTALNTNVQVIPPSPVILFDNTVVPGRRDADAIATERLERLWELLGVPAGDGTIRHWAEEHSFTTAEQFL